MLRAVVRQTKGVKSRSVGVKAGVQWLPHWNENSTVFTKRFLADIKKPTGNSKPSIHNSDAVVLPGSQSTTTTQPTPPPPGPVASVSPASPSPATPSSNTTIPPEHVPLVPPPPPKVKVQTTTPTSIPPPTTPPAAPSGPPSALPPPPPKRKPRRFRRFLTTLLLLGGLGYGGGVYYSLVSDNFHDFFTEYIPFGEDAVLYFEEREFRRRFPHASNHSRRPSTSTRDPDNKVTIPSKSGISWKVSEDENKGSDLQHKGRHMSALDANEPKPKVEQAKQSPPDATANEKIQAVEKAKKDSPPATANKSASNPKKAESEQGETKKTESKKKPEVDEPNVAAPTPLIDPLNISDADEPVVQDLVKVVNDIITVINADNASSKFSSSLNKAKGELAAVGGKIQTLRKSEKEAADEKIKSTQLDFDKAAKELIKRLEEEMRDQEAHWKDEFESEREKISRSYQEKLKTELERSKQVSEQRLRNELLEQAIEMKRKFVAEVKDRVETERNGRLGKLSELSTSVEELEKLTTEWNSVIDANLQTQHLQVAVDAVRSNLEMADRPTPFIKELAALKEVADEDAVVNAAIASINPTAYQRGVPTSAQLIDRFRRVAHEVRKASLLPEDAGVASHAASWVLSRALFKKRGLAVGDDAESLLTRTETLLEEGNLDEAAREMNGLQGWAKTLSKDWLGEVRKILEVQQAMDVSCLPFSILSTKSGR
ncbi:MAG: Formation of crista junctions protein 1 [Pleopsidium flavum]|nr:MAG: Formation of crista junctions protein 1 [Pleopsidium flavum]